MPDFDTASVSNTVVDFEAYRTFVHALKIGQVVTLNLENGETPRKVMRIVNRVGDEKNMRLQRLQSKENQVRFKVMPTEKRSVAISHEAAVERAAKARATRAARREMAAKVGDLVNNGLAVAHV